MKVRGLMSALVVILVSGACAEQKPGPSSYDSEAEDGEPTTPEPGDTDEPGLDAGDDGLGPTRTPTQGRTDPPPRVDASAPAQICQSQRVSGDRIKPEMLIVLDRSLSMKPGMGSAVNRWDPAVKGLKAITSELEKEIDFGLMIFPGSTATQPLYARDGGVTYTNTMPPPGLQWMVCAPGTVEADISPMNAAAIATTLDNTPLVPSTPTAATLKAARAAYEARRQVADLVALPPPYIVLVTDGDPNCLNGQDGNTTGQLAASIAEITAMYEELGIKTYVLGYGSDSSPTLRGSLDQMAAAGGTGDTKHREVTDEKTLIGTFKEIIGKALTCDFHLGQAAKDPAFLRVEIRDQGVKPDPANGWSLSPDKATVRLHGEACLSLQKTASTELSVKVECEPVTVF